MLYLSLMRSHDGFAVSQLKGHFDRAVIKMRIE